MRQWFTLMGFILVIVLILFLGFVVEFVLENREMFESTFKIVIPFPYHVWEGVKFVYIIIGSLLLGLSVALVISIISLILDTKRSLKLRSMRKELKHLQEALQQSRSEQEAQTTQPAEEDEFLTEEEQSTDLEAEPIELSDSSSVTPEEITRSFEDTIEKSNFLEKTKKRRDEQQSDESQESPDTLPKVYEEIRDHDITSSQEERAGDGSLHTDDQSSSAETPLEAEVVEGEEELPEKQRED